MVPGIGRKVDSCAVGILLSTAEDDLPVVMAVLGKPYPDRFGRQEFWNLYVNGSMRDIEDCANDLVVDVPHGLNPDFGGPVRCMDRRHGNKTEARGMPDTCD